MDSNIILEFLEIERGVSQYIDEIDNERQGYRIIELCKFVKHGKL